MKKGAKQNKRKQITKGYQWDLTQLYSSPHDPQIEKDLIAYETVITAFAKKYDVPEKKYLTDAAVLKACLMEYESIREKHTAKFYVYFYYMKDMDSRDPLPPAKISLFQSRLTQLENKMTFFVISLGSISSDRQKEFLANPNLKHYHVFLSRIFDDARHMLTVAEEKIMNLKSIPAHVMWTEGNDRMLNSMTVVWKKKKITVSDAISKITTLPKQADRIRLGAALASTLKQVAPLSEAEMNAIVVNHKIDDELRGYKTPYESTVRSYHNDPAVVENLVRTVTDNFAISHHFYEIKARLLKLKTLVYADRSTQIGQISTTFSFDQSAALLMKIFGDVHPTYAEIFGRFITERRIDTHPRVGKTGGAYCSSQYGVPTFVLLNHTDTFNSFTTIAHEMGHAFHSERSRMQGVLYSDYSYALAETASTFFESLALESIYESLSDKEKIILLHDKIQNDVATIFRQIACFNYEKDIHTTIRTTGFASARKLAELHNMHMATYLGPRFKFVPDDGYMFVYWGHLRSFFYVYSYAFGLLVSKALLRRYRADKKFLSSIEAFLSAGGSESPEHILRSIGIDVTSPEFFREGLREIEDDIARLEQLTQPARRK